MKSHLISGMGTGSDRAGPDLLTLFIYFHTNNGPDLAKLSPGLAGGEQEAGQACIFKARSQPCLILSEAAESNKLIPNWQDSWKFLILNFEKISKPDWSGLAWRFGTFR